MHIDRQPGVLPDKSADSARVVQMDVREEDSIQIGGGEAMRTKSFAQCRKRNGGAGIN
jgi:hypothetical protein